MRRSPGCTYPWMLALDGNTLDDCSLTFSWLSSRPWVPRAWPGPLPGPLLIRPAGEEGGLKDGSGRGAAPFSVAGGLRGSGKRGSRPWGCRRKSLAVRSYSTARATEASPRSSGICCMCQTG